MPNPVNPKAITAALAMVDAGAWGAKASLVNLVRLHTVDEPPKDPDDLAVLKLSYTQAARITGLDRRYAARCLDELCERDRVLVRIEGKGARPHAYAINGDVAGWQFVPWRLNPEIVTLRIAWLLAPEPRSTNHRVVARSSALLGPKAARPSAPQISPTGALQRATTLDLVARPSAPQTAPEAGGDTSMSFSHKEDEAGSGTADPEGLDRVLATIYDRTGRTLVGEPRRQIAHRVAELGATVAVAVAGRLARDLGAPLIVEAFRIAPVRVAAPSSANWEEPAPAWDDARAAAALGGVAAARAALRREAVGGVCETAADQENV